ncbi:MAG: hypothetical protein AWT59_1963 [Candidatus Gallionella acididurans]|uniref:Uncharacterized protein n=1 Tax=Candidatus Gallionella acididurans TaxID=1796491 RepID=A0A139BSE6_9PROT|nr:MAG: hypothetical protein AWT59_1963 [Candidatus Gallionella acididurans]
MGSANDWEIMQQVARRTLPA